MKLHQLQALVGVVDHGSIRAAARATHLTQAALTKSLRQLEEEQGVALLIRRASGVQLTPAGQRLLARARLVLRQIHLAEEEIRQSKDDATGVVRVGVTPYLMLTALGEAVRWFRLRYPRVALRLVEGLVTRVVPGLRDGSLDVALVADSGDLDASDLQRHPLLTEGQSLVVRRGHPVFTQATPAAQARHLVEQEWVLPGPLGDGWDDALLAMFRRAGMNTPALVTRCDALGAMALLRQSNAVTVKPSPLLAQPEAHGLVAVPGGLFSPPPVELVQVSPAGVPLSPAADYLARCLADAALGQAQAGSGAHRAEAMGLASACKAE